MYAYVKFTICEGTEIVPTSYISNFNPVSVIDFDKSFQYDVFWSSNPNDNPLTIFQKQGKIANVTKLNAKNKTGYYKARILKLAETRDSLENELNNPDLRAVFTQKITDLPVAQNDATNTINKKQKHTKELVKLAAKKNAESILELNKTDCTPSNSEISDSEAVGRATVSEKLYMELKYKYEILEKKHKKCSKETELQTRIDKLSYDFKASALCTKEFQETVLKKLEDLQVSSYSEGGSSIPHNPTSCSSSSSVFTVTEENVASDVQEFLLCDEFNTDSDVLKMSSSISVSRSKWLTAQKVKRGEAGDSMYTKNLSVVLWGSEELGHRSVTGQRCLSQKDSISKKQLSPEKVDIIKDNLTKRIKAEGGVSEHEMNRRVGNVRKYISEKIQTINRKGKI